MGAFCKATMGTRLLVGKSMQGLHPGMLLKMMHAAHSCMRHNE